MAIIRTCPGLPPPPDQSAFENMSPRKNQYPRISFLGLGFFSGCQWGPFWGQMRCVSGSQRVRIRNGEVKTGLLDEIQNGAARGCSCGSKVYFHAALLVVTFSFAPSVLANTDDSQLPSSAGVFSAPAVGLSLVSGTVMARGRAQRSGLVRLWTRRLRRGFSFPRPGTVLPR